MAKAPKPVRLGVLHPASALGAVAKPPPKLKVAGGGLTGSSLFASSFVSSFFGFVDAKKPSKPLFSPWKRQMVKLLQEMGHWYRK